MCSFFEIMLETADVGGFINQSRAKFMLRKKLAHRVSIIRQQSRKRSDLAGNAAFCSMREISYDYRVAGSANCIGPLSSFTKGNMQDVCWSRLPPESGAIARIWAVDRVDISQLRMSNIGYSHLQIPLI